jgi:hypothetical protein
VRVTVRGWNRNMGETVIGNHSLPMMKYSPGGWAYSNQPCLYEGSDNITVAWFQPLKLTGNYRMEVQLTRDDVMKLFKGLFGSKIQQGLVERYGLTFSPEVVKSVLKTVKLTDLTLGDLIAMSAESQPEETVETEQAEAPTNVLPITRSRA